MMTILFKKKISILIFFKFINKNVFLKNYQSRKNVRSLTMNEHKEAIQIEYNLWYL